MADSFPRDCRHRIFPAMPLEALNEKPMDEKCPADGDPIPPKIVRRYFEVADRRQLIGNWSERAEAALDAMKAAADTLEEANEGQEGGPFVSFDNCRHIPALPPATTLLQDGALLDHRDHQVTGDRRSQVRRSNCARSDQKEMRSICSHDHRWLADLASGYRHHHRSLEIRAHHPRAHIALFMLCYLAFRGSAAVGFAAMIHVAIHYVSLSLRSCAALTHC
jgi:hypothetical protein